MLIDHVDMLLFQLVMSLSISMNAHVQLAFSHFQTASLQQDVSASVTLNFFPTSLTVTSLPAWFWISFRQ